MELEIKRLDASQEEYEQEDIGDPSVSNADDDSCSMSSAVSIYNESSQFEYKTIRKNNTTK